MFQKGQKKPASSGRKKGTKNKKTLPGIELYLAERGINPLEKILHLIPQLDSELQLSAWKTLMSYCFAKPQLGSEGEDPHPPMPDDDTPTEDLLRMAH